MVFSWVVVIVVNVGRPGGCVFKDECVCKGGCSVIQCSNYVLMGCEECIEKCMAESVFCRQCIGY
jgi:hypothetical protein